MATNADNNVDDDDKEVTEDDLRALKYNEGEVETSNEEDETAEDDEENEETEEAGEEDGETDDQAEEGESEEDAETDSDEDEPEFVKEYPYIKGDTPEEYAKNLEEAYKQSTAEALRLKDLADKAPPKTDAEDEEEADLTTPTDPVSLFMKQKMDEEIDAAYSEFSKEFPQVAEPAEYQKFIKEVSTLSRTIMSSQGRLASPKELYAKAAVILDWERQETAPSKEERIKMAAKANAASSKTSSSTKKAPKSKVTDAMVKANRLMYPNKSDDDIRKELEPYV